MAQLGADVIAPEGFEERGPFDVILELVGAPNLPGNLLALRPVGPDHGDRDQRRRERRAQPRHRHAEARPHPQLHPARLARSRRRRSAARAVERSVLPLLASGAIRVPIAATYPLEEAPAAYDRFAAGGKLGNIVLTMGG